MTRERNSYIVCRIVVLTTVGSTNIDVVDM